MNVKRFIILLVALPVLISLTSCNSILCFIYGMKATKEYSPSEIQKIAGRYNIEPSGLFILQNSYNAYFDSIGVLYGYNPNSCDTSQVLKHHYQPLQVLFFDRSGNLVAFHNNCYCGGFPNLRWNRNGTFDSIPARAVIPTDTLLELNTLAGFLKDLDGNGPDLQRFEKSDYTIAVFWTTFMGRQSKRLIRVINDKYSDDKNISILYINADSIFESLE
jgi:hypothetical protein